MSRIDLCFQTLKSFSCSILFALSAIISANELTLPLPNTQADGQIPASPRESLAKIEVPKGFKVTLFAGEPDISQPISMTIDARGRLWVAQCFSSPDWNDGESGSDRILIFEDTDNDGQFDSKKVFADKLPNLTSIQLGLGGVWACCAPRLLFFPDADRDDRPDGPAQAKLDGWLTPDHNLFNGLTWGPDGWLYGCHGILDTSNVGKPGTRESERKQINCGIWRFHPITEDFEVVCHGTTNPWGLDFDEAGQGIFTNCVIGHLWHLIPGAHYRRMFGVDFNPYVYELIDTCADHFHWQGGDWTSSRFGIKHGDAGGGHAHSGAMIYLGDNWPDEYRGSLFLSNLHGNRINRDVLNRKGSGIVGSHAPDFLMANDPWFRALELLYGPDGGVYISDWTDFGECHDNDGVHRSSGRIYKVVYEKPNEIAPNLDLYRKSNAQLVELQYHKNAWYGRWARRILQERSAGEKRLEAKLVDSLIQKAVERNASIPHRLRALWTLHACEHLQDQTLISLLTDRNADIRAWAVRLAVDVEPKSKPVIAQIKRSAMSVISDFDKLHFASALGRMPKSERMNMAFALIGLDFQTTHDKTLQLMIWYSLEPVVLDVPVDSLKLASRIRMPLVSQFIVKRLLTEDSTLVNDVIEAASKSSFETQLAMLRSITEIEVTGGFKIGKESKRRLFAFDKSNDIELQRLSRIVGAQLGFDSLRRELWEDVDNKTLDADFRKDAIQMLGRHATSQEMERLIPLLDDESVADAVLEVMESSQDVDVADHVLSRFGELANRHRFSAIELVTQRPEWARRMFAEIAAGRVSPDYVRPLAIQRLRSMRKPDIDEQISRFWPLARLVSGSKQTQIKKYKAILGDDVVQFGNASTGKEIFVRVCGQCHKMYGEGGTIGPDLTGSGRHDLDYVLQNVVDPSAVVAKNYQASTIVTKDGKVISGIVLRRSTSGLELQTAEKVIQIGVNDIAEENLSGNSIMPDGLFDQLDEKQLRDLVAFLFSEGQGSGSKE